MPLGSVTSARGVAAPLGATFHTAPPNWSVKYRLPAGSLVHPPMVTMGGPPVDIATCWRTGDAEGSYRHTRPLRLPMYSFPPVLVMQSGTSSPKGMMLKPGSWK